MRSSNPAEARRVRTVLNSLCAWSTDLLIRVCASVISSSTVAMPGALLRSFDDRADFIAGDDTTDIAVGELEDVNGELVVHAERERGRVHHLEPALDRLEVRQPRQEPRLRVHARIAVVDAPDAVLRHQDRVRPYLQRAQGRRRVGREERVARAGGED